MLVQHVSCLLTVWSNSHGSTPFLPFPMQKKKLMSSLWTQNSLIRSENSVSLSLLQNRRRTKQAAASTPTTATPTTATPPTAMLQRPANSAPSLRLPMQFQKSHLSRLYPAVDSLLPFPVLLRMHPEWELTVTMTGRFVTTTSRENAGTTSKPVSPRCAWSSPTWRTTSELQK